MILLAIVRTRFDLSPLRVGYVRMRTRNTSCVSPRYLDLGLIFLIREARVAFERVAFNIIDDRLFFCYRFRIDNTDHIIDVNKNNAAFEYDQVNIICPVYQPGTYDEDAEKYIIYNVSSSILCIVSYRNARNLDEKRKRIVTIVRVFWSAIVVGSTDKSSYTTVDPLCEIKNCQRVFRVLFRQLLLLETRSLTRSYQTPRTTSAS